jgi:hypothetical protein
LSGMSGRSGRRKWRLTDYAQRKIRMKERTL